MHKSHIFDQKNNAIFFFNDLPRAATNTVGGEYEYIHEYTVTNTNTNIRRMAANDLKTRIYKCVYSNTIRIAAIRGAASIQVYRGSPRPTYPIFF